MAKKFWIPVIAGISALTLVSGVGVANALNKNEVTLVVDGEAKNIGVREKTVAQVLDLEDIEIGQHDMVLPGPDTKIKNEMEINVAHGRPLDISLDGEKRKVWTTALSLGDALRDLDLNEPDSKYTPSRSTPLGREGLSVEIATAKDVTVTVAGEPTELTVAGTVGDALDELDINPSKKDKVKPEADTDLIDGLEITYIAVEHKKRTEEVAIPFKKTEVESNKLEKGTEKITTKGVDGLKTESWTDIYEDGELVDSKLKDTEVSKEPVKQVTAIGTKKPKSTSSSGGSSSSSESKSSSGGSDSTPASGNKCKASYYGQGQMTASGEQFNPNDFTAAHKTLPFNSKVKVTNVANGKTTTVRINDRGPFISGRCLDLSRAAMEAIGGTSAGVADVAWEVVG